MALVENDRHIIVKRARDTRLLFVKSGTSGGVGKVKFDFNDVIGRQFGVAYEVKQKKLFPHVAANADSTSMTEIDEEMEIDSIDKEGEGEIDSIDNETKIDSIDNESIDNEDSSSFSHQEVEKMRKTGESGHVIITKLAMDNTSFKHKTVYAREKYLIKKAKKYSAVIVVYPPTIRSIQEIYFQKDADKIAYLRQDCLAHLLTWSNVHSGCRLAVVEQCLGIVTAAVLERMSGRGQCVRLHKGTSLQSVPCLAAMDFDARILESLLPVPLDDFLNLKTDDDGEEKDEAESEKKDEAEIEGDAKTVRREQREVQKMRGVQLLKEKQLDGFIIAGKEHPMDLLRRLLNCTQPSRPFVVFCSYVQPLLDCYQWLRDDGKALNVRLVDNFYRKHQILPGRSHPEMNQPVAGGYILTGVTILDK